MVRLMTGLKYFDLTEELCSIGPTLLVSIFTQSHKLTAALYDKGCISQFYFFIYIKDQYTRQ